MDNIPDQYVNDPRAPFNYEPTSSDELAEQKELEAMEQLDEEFQTKIDTN